MESRICANLELQKQDSLLQLQIALIEQELKEDGEDRAFASFELGQKLWEHYRHAHCTSILSEDMSRIDMILFMKCAAQITENRRRELARWFGERKD